MKATDILFIRHQLYELPQLKSLFLAEIGTAGGKRKRKFRLNIRIGCEKITKVIKTKLSISSFYTMFLVT